MNQQKSRELMGIDYRAVSVMRKRLSVPQKERPKSIRIKICPRLRNKP
jgi:hypothetical protein